MNKVKSYINDLSILFIDDEDGVRESYDTLLNMWAKKAYSASNGKEGLELYKKYKPDIIITDIKMPVMSGLEMIGEIKKIDPDFPIIITTAHQEPELLLEAIKYQVDAYIIKPIPKKELRKYLETIGKVLVIEKELKETEELNQLYLNNAGAFMMMLDTEGIITMINKSGLEILGFTHDELIGKNWFEIGVLAEEVVEDVKSYFSKLVSGSIQLPDQKYQNSILTRSGKILVLAWSNTVLTKNDNVVGVLCSALDITELDKVQKKLKEQSYIDTLTNIYNRKYYNEKILELLSLYERYQTPFSVLMYDIDNFKTINDNYGHDIGDNVLIEMSQLIQSYIRKNDYLIRIGGEEFIILFSETHLQKAKIVAEKIRNGVEKDLNTLKDSKITISIGLTEVEENDTKDTIFKRIDTLLYRSKNSGKNRVSSD